MVSAARDGRRLRQMLAVRFPAEDYFGLGCVVQTHKRGSSDGPGFGHEPAPHRIEADGGSFVPGGDPEKPARKKSCTSEA